jgi:hypothetical protein
MKITHKNTNFWGKASSNQKMNEQYSPLEQNSYKKTYNNPNKTKEANTYY